MLMYCEVIEWRIECPVTIEREYCDHLLITDPVYSFLLEAQNMSSNLSCQMIFLKCYFYFSLA